MSRVCDVTGRKPMYGNNVSHAHNKSRRRFDINLQKKRFWLSDEKRWITLKVSTQGLRLIDKIGIRKVVSNLVCRASYYAIGTCCFHSKGMTLLFLHSFELS